MSALYDLFQTDTSLEEGGAWVELPGDMKIKVRAFTSKAVSDLREKLLAPHQMLLRAGGKIPDKQNEDIGLKVIAGAVIADWENFTTKEGEPLPYSADNAYAVLKALPRLVSFVINLSSDTTFFKGEELRADNAKN